MQAFGLYTHIRANRIRSVLLIAGLFLLVYVMVFAAALLFEAMQDDALDAILARAMADMIAAVPIATIAAGLWLAIAWFFHQTIIDAMTGGHGLTREDDPRLYNLLENLCISRGLAMPRLTISETSAVNAFATGLNERQYAITVTRGLIDTLDEAEMEAVLAHELTHIRNNDVRVMVIAVIIAGVLSFFGELAFRWMLHRPTGGGLRMPRPSRSDGDGKKGGGAFLAILIAVVLIALAWFLSLVIRFALSRSREYLADAGAVELTKNPDAMISALRKISGRGELENVPSGIMELCIDNPRSGFVDLFATHPAIDDRIAALVAYAGGRDLSGNGGNLAPTAPETSSGPA